MKGFEKFVCELCGERKASDPGIREEYSMFISKFVLSNILFLLFFRLLEERPRGNRPRDSLLVEQDLQFLKSVRVLAYDKHQRGDGGNPEEAPKIEE